MSDRTITVLVTLTVYKVTLLAIGLFANAKTNDETEFYLGGRSLGPWVAALSASASSSSAWTLLAVSGAAYSWGLSAVWLFPACVGGFVFNWIVLAPAVQRVGNKTGALTVIELVAGPRDREFSRLISAICAIIVLCAFTIYVAAQLQGAGKTFEDTFGWSMTHSVLVGAGVVIVYTLLGGFWAVSLTDTLQGAAMAATALIIPVAVVLACGGPVALVNGIGTIDAPGWLDPLAGAGGAAGLGFVLGTFGIGLGYPGQPHVANRFMALRLGQEAITTARRVAIGWAVIIYCGMLIVGWGGRILYPILADNETVFIHITNGIFPPVVSGILLAAVLSAVMSTADSQLLVAGSSVSHDLGLGSGKRALLWSRVVVLTISVFAVVAALFGSQSIFDKVLSAWWLVGFTLGPTLIVTTIKGPVPPIRILIAVLVGGGLTFIANLIPATDKTLVESVLPFVLGLLIVWPWKRAAPQGENGTTNIHRQAADIHS
ncbi:MAG: sodium/proline symporter [Candidatus Latescibacterota bacterium]|nr:sodium/proline symporter [Candidatus Latescibacterota bacterium]